MNTKICNRCKKEYELCDQNFSFKNKEKGWYQPWCKTCTKEYKDLHYKDNKDDYIKKAKRVKLGYRDRWRQFKSTLSCVKCGENHPACLDFHHIDPNNKEYTLASMIQRQRSIIAVKKEIEKCIVLCSNCHRKEHYLEE